MANPSTTDSQTQTARFDWAVAFQDHEPLSKAQVREVREINEVFAKQFSETLSASLRTRVTSGIVEMRQAGPAEKQGRMPDTSLMFLLGIEPLRSSMVVALDAPLVYRVLNGLLGSRGDSEPESDRELTDIELSILQSLGPVLVRSLEKAWQPAGPWSFSITTQRRGLGTKHLSALGEGFVVMELAFQIDETTGHMTLLYPLVVGQSSLPEPSAATASSDPAHTAFAQYAVLEKLRAAPLEIEASIPDCTIRIGDLLRLQAGDVVRLDAAVNRQVDLSINGERRLQGRFVPSDRKRALQVEHILLPRSPKAEDPPDEPAPDDDATDLSQPDVAE